MIRYVVVALGAVLLVAPLLARAAHGDHVVVSEVQVGGASAKDEFVEIYNPTAAAISLEGWRLSKRTASGSESNLLTAFPAMTIAPHASVLIAAPDGAFAAQADVTYSTTASLAADNACVLYSPAGTDGARAVADLVGWGTAVGEGTAAANPAASTSLERKPGGAEGNATDTGDNAVDFTTQSTPTPQNASAAARPVIVDEVVVPPSAGEEVGSDESTAPLEVATPSETIPSSPPSADPPKAETPTSSTTTEPSHSPPPPQPTHVRLNEFVSDPADDDGEWIELANIGPNAVNLVDWTIEDGAERRTVLNGALPIGGFFVVSAPKGVLNNGGDRIVLRQPDGTAVDAVSYGDWNDGKASDNAPAVSDPASVARVVDGVDTDNDRADWVRTETPTKGAANVVASVPDDPATTSPSPSVGSARGGRGRAIIVLNELLPDPAGDDLTDEYVEIVNLGDGAVDLAGWRLTDELGTEHAIARDGGETAIGPGGFLVLPRSRTGIALNNTGGETVRLFKPDADRATSVASWSGAAAESSAWARGEDGRWRWTTTPTVGEANAIATPNRAPDAVVEGPAGATPSSIVAFDASDSADPDGESLSYLWDFGDPATEADVATAVIGRYVYASADTYTVTLTVTDARGATATVKWRVTVGGVHEDLGVRDEGRAPSPSSSLPPHPSSTTVRLSELLPNPTGSDDGEWVEVENTGDRDASLDGWSLVSVGATARVTELPADVVPAHGFLVLPRSVVRFALRNDGAAIELRDPDGAVVDSIAYEKVREGWSYARGLGGCLHSEAPCNGAEEWQWTSAPTPGAGNAFVLGARVGEGRRLLPTPSTSPSRREGENQPLPVAIAELDDLPRGEIVAVRGVITAPLGSVGKQVLYVADATGGVQIFVGKRVIPPLAVGTTVSVTGELREANGEQRIGIRAPEDVAAVVRDAAAQPLEPQQFRIADAQGGTIGDLVTFEGEVMEVRGRIIHVDDGSDEIRVALPAVAVDAAEQYRAGDAVRVTGILGRTQAGYRVLAREPADLAITRRARIASAAEAAPLQSFRRSLELSLLTGIVVALALPLLWRRRQWVGDMFQRSRS